MPESQDAMMSAVRRGDLAGVRRLAAEAPDSLDAVGPDGRMPLVLAASVGADEVVALLLELGADAARRDGEGRTAFSAEWRRSRPPGRRDVPYACGVW
ncbi:MAG: hypothetical protein AVDCRST_MAG04-3956 [uncultured Acetobacteraceae bacterium]|uniref:Uncharacterized protein n=1 Tax=uncultured Acetobacteraceae bacterium TaxID=169975 RepID=A0A6J4JP20_9PROT|nr:MAG: hypothetical protein AVDCRST_MAG04-3956 [uncultured Acetobacteraceae bacterium]